jgi:hypothetical protein
VYITAAHAADQKEAANADESQTELQNRLGAFGAEFFVGDGLKDLGKTTKLQPARPTYI